VRGGNIYSICNSIAAVIYSFHMPAFIMISGYSYKRYLANKAEDIKEFIRVKAIELLIPYAIFSVIFGGLKILGESYTLSPSGMFDLVVFPIKPIGYLWFIYTLFILYSATALLQKYRISLKLIIVVAIIMHVLFYFVDIPWFDINRLLRYSFFFYLGIILCEKEAYVENRLSIGVIVSLSIVFVISQIIYIGLLGRRIEFSTQFYNSTEYPILYFVCAFVGSILLYAICKCFLNNRELDKTWIYSIGKNSLIYYLLHQMIISVLRAIGLKLNIISPLYQILVIFGGTLLLCAFVVFLTKRYNIIAGIFYPKKWIIKK